MIKGYIPLPEYVSMTRNEHKIILRLTENLTYRKDAGAWTVDAELFPDGSLISISDKEHLNGIPLLPASRNEYIEDNLFYLVGCSEEDYDNDLITF